MRTYGQAPHTSRSYKRTLRNIGLSNTEKFSCSSPGLLLEIFCFCLEFPSSHQCFVALIDDYSLPNEILQRTRKRVRRMHHKVATSACYCVTYLKRDALFFGSEILGSKFGNGFSIAVAKETLSITFSLVSLHQRNCNTRMLEVSTTRSGPSTTQH